VLLARLRLGIVVGLPLCAVGAALNVVFATDHLGARLSGFGVLTALYGLTLALTRWRAAARRASALAIGYVLALAGSLFYLISLSPADVDVLSGPVSWLLMAAMLFFPWGAGVQGAISGAIAVGYAALVWAHGGGEGMRTFNVALNLGVAVVVSVIGAGVIERSRQHAFRERRRVRALAVQRRRLIEVGRDLRSTLSFDEIVQRLVVHALRLIPADGVLMALREPDAGAYRIAAASGDDRLLALTDVQWDERFTAVFCRAFAPAEVRECPGGPLDALVVPGLREHGVERALIAAVGPNPGAAGFVFWTRRSAQPFSRAHRLAAQGIADQAFTALSAARLYEDAARASRLKSEFVSTMSHELRTPLNVIMGYNQILHESLDPEPETSRALDAVRRASLELLDLVDATLDLGRLEAGREHVREEPVAVRELFDELARELAPVPRAANVVLRWDAGDGPTLIVDRRKLKTVLKNLAGNALKFTPAGTVRVECRRVDEQCVFRVVDTGIGIRPEDQAAVFEMFRQADSSDTRRYGGTGLGLYIVRQLVRLLAGEITLQSTVGRGSTFTVTVPLAGTRGGRQRPAA
jgi:signal transduction histidine kinase